jgi:hypothetical protein
LLLFANRISCDIEDFVFLIEAQFSNGTSIDGGVIGANDSVKHSTCVEPLLHFSELLI